MITERSRRLLATTAVVGLAALSAGCGGGGGDTGGGAVDAVRIGLLFPTSGAFATLGQDQAGGAKMVLDWVNANGGVGGVPVEIFEADSQSDPGVGATTAQRLIDQNEVDIIIGSYSSAISQAILPVAQRNDVILWEVGAVSRDINADGNTNFLRTVGSAETYAQANVDFLTGYLAERLGKPVTDVRVAIVHEDGAFGSSVATYLEELAAQKGLTIVAKDSYPLDSKDLTPLVLRVKQAAPDVLFLAPLVADAQLFWDQARTQDLNIPAVVGSAGFGSPVFLEKFGPAGVEGAYDVEPPALANMNLDGLDPELQTLLEGWLADFERAHGKACLVHCGDGIGGAYVLVKDVLPRALAEAGNVDAASIVAAAGKTDMPPGSTPQGFGVKFNPPGAEKVGDNAAAYSTIMQWQHGELNVVWPRDIANAEPVFPMPTWDKR